MRVNLEVGCLRMRWRKATRFSTDVPKSSAIKSDFAPIDLPGDLSQNGSHVIHELSEGSNLGEPQLVVRGLPRADGSGPAWPVRNVRFRCSGHDELAEQNGISRRDAREHRS